MATTRKGNSLDELQLLEAVLRPDGDAARSLAYNRFVQRYERLIVSCVRKVLHRYGASYDPEDLADLVNDVWLQLLRDDRKKLKKYDPTRGYRLASFIGMVATNTTIDHLRSRPLEAASLDEVTDDSVALAAPGDAPSVKVEREEQAELVRAALARLSADERRFLVEVFQAERAPDEVARTLRINVNTVYSRKFKIREKLQRIVGELEAA
jgi:RNA polymerase sigma-70 factor (ECF subfamily)